MPFAELDIAAEMLQVFRQVNGDIAFSLRFVEEVAVVPNCSIHGECDFSQCPPAISIRTGLGCTDLVEILCHEFAHLACGLEAGHDETWEKNKHELSVRFWARRIHV